MAEQEAGFDIQLRARCGEGEYDIGVVRVLNGISEDYANTYILEAWPGFQETEPDTDSEFVEYLIGQYPEVFGHGESVSVLVVN